MPLVQSQDPTDQVAAARRRASIRRARSRATARRTGAPDPSLASPAASAPAPEVQTDPLESIRRQAEGVSLDLPSDLPNFVPRDPNARDIPLGEFLNSSRKAIGANTVAIFAETVLGTARTGLEIVGDMAEANLRRRPSGMSPSEATRGRRAPRTTPADLENIRRQAANIRAQEELIEEVIPIPDNVVGGLLRHLGRETLPFIAASAATSGMAAPSQFFSLAGRTAQRAKRGSVLFGTLDLTTGDFSETAREEGLVDALKGLGIATAGGAVFEAGLIGPVAEVFGAQGARALNRARVQNKARAEIFNARRRERAGQQLIDEAATSGRIGPERQLAAPEPFIGPLRPAAIVPEGVAGEAERVSAREGLRRAAGTGARDEARIALEAEQTVAREARSAERTTRQDDETRVLEAIQAELQARRAVRDITTREGVIGTERQLLPRQPGTKPGVIEMTGESEVLTLGNAARRASEPGRRTAAFVGPRREPQTVTEALTESLTRSAEEPLTRGATGATEARIARDLADDARLLRRVNDMDDEGLVRAMDRLFTDPRSGLRNQTAWFNARNRIRDNPNIEVSMLDIENLKSANTLLGMEGGTALIRDAAQMAERHAIAAGLERRGLFTPFGDEIIITGPVGTTRAVADATVKEFGDRAIIAGVGERTSLRVGTGPNFEVAEAAAEAAKKVEIASGRVRGRETPVVPGAEAPPPEFPQPPRVAATPPAQVTAPPRVISPRSQNATAVRRTQLRQTEEAVIREAPEPTGRRNNQVPHDAEAGPNGPVDRVIDQATGKTVADTRTRAVRLKQALLEGDEGGFIEGTKDILEKRAEPNLPEHSQRIQDQMSIGERTRRRFPSLLDIYTRLVRRSAGIEAAGRRLRPRTRGARVTQNDVDAAAALATGSARRAEAMLMYGPGDFSSSGDWVWQGAPGFMEILAPLEGQLNAFRRYSFAKRAIEVGRRDINAGITLDDALLEINMEQSGAVLSAQKQTVGYLEGIARYYQNATGMPEAQLQRMLDLGLDYIPLTRVFEGTDPLALGGGGTVGRPGAVIRKLLGSGRRIVDPIESIVDYTQRMTRAADINRIGRTLVDAAVENPEAAAGFIERVARLGRAGTEKEALALQNSLAARGRNITIEEAGEIVESLGDDALQLTDDIIRVWRNGEIQAWRVDPTIARGIRAMQPAQMNWMVQLMSMPSRAARAGITLNPGFQAFNIIRDTFDASIQSRYGFRLGIDSFKGFYESSKAQWLDMPSDVYMEAAASGFGFSAIRGTGRQTTQQLVRRLLPKVTTRSGRVFDMATMPLRHPYQALTQFAVPFEEAARMGEFMRAKSRGANTVEALMASKTVTVDFQQIGSTMQSFAYMTKFFNAGLQSLDIARLTAIRPVVEARAALRAGETPAQAAAIATKEAARVYGTAIGAITIPTMMLWAANRGDQEIEDLRKSPAGSIYWFYRDPFHLDADGNEEIIRMPKPFLYGQIFGTGIEAILDKMFDDDPEAMGRWAQGVAEQAAVNMFPDAIVMSAEQFFNKDVFYNSQIVPEELELVEPGMQFTERTSRIAVKIGETFPSVSPVRIDKLFKDTFGSMPVDIMRQIDRSIDRFNGDAVTMPAPMRNEIAFFGRFFARNPSLSVEPVQTFWDNAKQAQEALASLDLANSRQNFSKAQELLEDRMPDFLVATLYEGARRSITDIRNSIDAVREMPDALFRDRADAAETKRLMTNEFLRQYVETTRVTNEVARLIAEQFAAEQAAAVPAGVP